MDYTDEELEQMSEEQLEQLLMEESQKKNTGFPIQEEKPNIYNFFKKILETDNTTKVGNLDEPEITAARALLNAQLFTNILGYDKVGKYLNAKAQNITSTSLSRKGFLVLAAITQKRFLSTSSGEGKEEISGGGRKWIFGKKKQQMQPQM